MTTYSKYLDTLRDTQGVVLPNRNIFVYLTGTQTLASLFEDDDTTALPNPILSGPAGEIAFNVAIGNYDIVAEIDNYALVEKTNVPICPSSVGGATPVTSFNTLTGAVTISAGSNITLTPSGNNIAISASGGGGGSNALMISPVILDSPLAPSSAGAAQTNGRTFYPTQIFNVTGINFYWGGSTSQTINCSLWNAAGTKVASCNVSVTAPGKYTGTFGSAYTLVSGDLGTRMAITISESTGTTCMAPAYPSSVPQYSPSSPGLVFGASVYSSSVDTNPTSVEPSGGAYQYIVEPITA